MQPVIGLTKYFFVLSQEHRDGLVGLLSVLELIFFVIRFGLSVHALVLTVLEYHSRTVCHLFPIIVFKLLIDSSLYVNIQI